MRAIIEHYHSKENMDSRITQIELLLIREENNARQKLRGSCAGGYQYQCGYDDCEAKWLPIARQLLTIAKETNNTRKPS